MILALDPGGLLGGVLIVAFLIAVGVKSGGFTKKEREIKRTDELTKIRKELQKKGKS